MSSWVTQRENVVTEINSWVAAATNNLIDSILDSSSLYWDHVTGFLFGHRFFSLSGIYQPIWVRLNGPT
jgi:serine protease inhibitor